ncbi:MAG TPA: NfeD family protein [Rhodocyclaceae bacterium]|nr:NfeD family protein [Rhodocyclaceae bacterium]
MSELPSVLTSPWSWLIAGLVIAGLEIAVPGVMLLWIGLGAMLVGVALLLLPELSLNGQLVLFAVAMLGAIGAGLWVQRRSGATAGGTEINRELQGLVGQRFAAVTDFTAGRGRIRVGDTTYAAESTQPIRAGALVVVEAVADGRLKVRPEDA